jgi:outer membrane protein assembly factor BamB
LFSGFRVVIFLAIVFVLPGCGTVKNIVSGYTGGVDNTEPPSPLVEISETTRLNNIWSHNVGKGTDELFIKLVPAILDDKLFIADTRGNISAFYTETGKNIWQKDSDLAVTGGPGADENLVMVGTSEGEVVSFSTETGEEIWRSTVSSEILSSPRESDGVTVVRTIDGKIFALDANTGERLWIYDRTVPALTLRGTSTPIIANGLIIAGFDGGRVTALELKTGKLIWESKVAVSRGRSEIERMVDIDAQPLIFDNVIYISTFQANVSAISLENGQILWQRDISSYTELGADNNNLYVTDETGNVWALDRFSGASIWKQEKLTHRQVTGPAVLGEMIVVGDLEGYLHWMDKKTGEFAARKQIDSDPILTKPIVSNDILFAYSSGGTLSAYSYYGREPKESPAEPVVEEQTEPEDTALSTEKATDTEEPPMEDSESPAESEEKSSSFGRFLEIFTGDSEEEE